MPPPNRELPDLPRSRGSEMANDEARSGRGEWGGGAGGGLGKAEATLADHGIFSSNIGPAGERPPPSRFPATLARLKRALVFAHAAPEMRGNRRASCCLLEAEPGQDASPARRRKYACLDL